MLTRLVGEVRRQENVRLYRMLAEPASPTGALIGYTRVSTGGQRPDRQTHALTEAGCIRIFADKKSGKNIEREELWKALDHLRAGDTLVAPSLDRLGRSLQDLIAIVAIPGELDQRRTFWMPSPERQVRSSSKKAIGPAPY